jgi:hypothetical protein
VGLLRVGSDVRMQLAARSAQMIGKWKVSFTLVAKVRVAEILKSRRLE